MKSIKKFDTVIDHTKSRKQNSNSFLIRPSSASGIREKYNLVSNVASGTNIATVS